MSQRYHDYTLPGYYAVTICIEYRRWLFGRIIDGEVCLSEAGQIARKVWETLPQRFPHVQLHEYVFMPNHMHGILELTEIGRPSDYPKVPLGQIIRTFKAATTYQIRHREGRPWFAWQVAYWKSVLLTEDHVQKVRQYILDNPLRWPQDQLYHTISARGHNRNP